MKTWLEVWVVAVGCSQTWAGTPGPVLANDKCIQSLSISRADANSPAGPQRGWEGAVELAREFNEIGEARLLGTVIDSVVQAFHPERLIPAQITALAHLLHLFRETPNSANAIKLHALAREAVQSYNRQLGDIRSACDRYTLSARMSDRSLAPERLGEILDLIHALPQTEGRAKLTVLLPSLLITAREVDGYTGGKSGWKKGRRINESALEFAARIGYHDPTGNGLIAPTELLRYQLQVTETLMQKNTDVDFVRATLLRLDPSPATSKLLELFADRYQLTGTPVGEIMDLWARSNKLSAGYLLRPRLDPATATRVAEYTPFFYASQLALARFLVRTGEAKWMARGTNIVRAFSDEVGPLKETHGGRLVTSPLILKINAMLSLAELIPTRKTAFVLDALDLADMIPSGTPEDFPGAPNEAILRKLVDKLAEVKETKASLGLGERWAKVLAVAQDQGTSADTAQR